MRSQFFCLLGYLRQHLYDLSVNDDVFLRCELLTSYVVSSYADILATRMSGPRWSYSGSETDHSYDACNHMTPDTIHVHSVVIVMVFW